MHYLNLKSTFNHLKNNKFHTLLNIFGLALGMLFFVHLVRYIGYEKNYETYFPESAQIYRVNYDIWQGNNNMLHSAKTPRKLFTTIKDELPEVQQSSIAFLENVLVRYNEKHYSSMPTLWIEGDFVELFGLKMVQGESKINNPFTCIISQSMADRVFGNENPLGKQFSINEGMKHEITGIYQDIPKNSHLSFDFFLSLKTWYEFSWIPRTANWNGAATWTYIKLKPNSSPQQVEQGLATIADKYLTHLKQQNRTGKFTLQPLAEIHYTSNRSGLLGISTNPKTIGALILITILILLVIWMNYVNLSTALARKRLNVFATYRKLGAGKRSILSMAFAESLMINLAAILVGILLYFLTIHLFDWLIDTPLSKGTISYKFITTVIIGTVLAGIGITALLSAIPAIKVNPALTRQTGAGRSTGSMWLVGLQFFISCFLVICSFMITKQIRFMQHADLGINLENVLVLNGPASTNIDSLRGVKFNAFRDEMLQSPLFKSGSAMMNVPGQPLRFRNSNISLRDRRSELKQEIAIGHIDNNFISTFGLELLAGRNFDLTPVLDTGQVILSESAVKILGIASASEAIGNVVRQGNALMRIKGVVSDFHHEGLQKAAEPIIFFHRHPIEFGYYTFKLSGNINQAIDQAKIVWQKHYPNDPFDYFFNDAYFNAQYKDEQRLSKILSAFTIFSILIAALGLFGLVTFYAQQRTKEIGIRKINGASVRSIIFHILDFFIRFEVLAFIIACPLATIVINQWLEGFAYKTTISWWIYPLTGFIALAISIASVIVQAWKAANKNPVEALRLE